MKSFARFLIFVPFWITEKYARVVAKLRPDWVHAWSDVAYGRAANLVTDVTHVSAAGEVSLKFFTPNAVCRFRANTFSSKEPETLEWIDKFGGSGAFFDVGANIGLYSVYYGLTQPGTVYAFEPSVLNLALLAKNVSANDLAGRVVIVANPLTAMNETARFNLSMLDEGGSMSTFGEDYGHDGKPLVTQLSYQTVGFQLDFLMATGIVSEMPALLKIDVDGIEHLILRGAGSVLIAPQLRSVLIEVNDDFRELASEVSSLLSAAGFTLVERRGHADSGQFAATSNQIWVRA